MFTTRGSRSTWWKKHRLEKRRLRRPRLVRCPFLEELEDRTLFAASVLASVPPALGAAAPHFIQDYGNLPLSFEPNQGQARASSQFLAHGPGYDLLLDPTEAVLLLPKASATGENSQSGSLLPMPAGSGLSARNGDGLANTAAPGATQLRMQFLHANPAAHGAGVQELPGKVSYLIGQASTQLPIGIPTYARVEYQDVYPGIDVVYYGNPQQPEYDLIVRPGADPSAIVLNFDGADNLALDGQGDLVVRSGANSVQLESPSLYQELNGARQPVAGRYVLLGNHQVAFQIGSYNAASPLIIDPILLQTSYLPPPSPMDYTIPDSIAVDPAGNVYVTGHQGFVVGLNDRLPNSAFITALTPSGQRIYTTYFNAVPDSQLGITVDSAGDAYLTGTTDSGIGWDVPTTTLLPDLGQGNVGNGFVAKVGPSGAFEYVSLLGGAECRGVAVDAAGEAYITGQTNVAFPQATGAFPGRPSNGRGNGFVAKLSPDGSRFVYATYLNQFGQEVCDHIALDASGDAYVTGGVIDDTGSALFKQAFVQKLDANGSLLYSQEVASGPSGWGGPGIAVDPYGKVHLCGNTTSGDYVVALRATGSVIYNTSLGTSILTGIAADAQGNAYVTGITSSDLLPLRALPADLARNINNGSKRDALVAQFNPAGNLVFSTPLGGSAPDEGTAIALDPAGYAYVAGLTLSTNFPPSGGWKTISPSAASPNAAVTSLVVPGGWDTVFVSKIAVPWSFGVSHIEVNQAVPAPDINGDGIPDIVAGRPTVVRVTVSVPDDFLFEHGGNTNLPVEVKLTIGNSPDQPPPQFPTLGTLLRNPVVDFFWTPPDVPGDVDITATVDPEDQLQVGGNKSASVTVDVKKVQNVKYEIRRLDEGSPDDQRFPVDGPGGQGDLIHDYLQEVFPVDPASFSTPIGDPYSSVRANSSDPKYIPVRMGNGNIVNVSYTKYDASKLEQEFKIARRTGSDPAAYGAARVIVIVPGTWFDNAPDEEQLMGSDGVWFPDAPHVVFVRDTWITLAAHELGHSYGFNRSGEDYRIDPITQQVTYRGTPTTGYWVEGQEEIDNAVSYMGIASLFVPRIAPHSWTTPKNFLDLFKDFVPSPLDPEVLVVSGFYDSSGNVGLLPMYRALNGTVSQPTPGDAAVQVLDANGKVLAAVPFAFDFNLPDVVQPQDVMPFVFEVPYPAGAAQVQIVRAGQALARMPIATRLLHDAVESIPDTGFVQTPGQLRQALLNQVEVLDTQLAAGDDAGALDTLSAMRQNLVSDLVDGYTTETDLQYTKPEILALVDELIQRTGKADLAVTVSATPNPVAAGKDLTYTIRVTNYGPDPALAVTVTDSLPAATTFSSCSADSGGVCTGSGTNATVTFASLASGATGTITLIATVDASAPDGVALRDTAAVNSPRLDLSSEDNSAAVSTSVANGALRYTITDVGGVYPRVSGTAAVSDSKIVAPFGLSTSSSVPRDLFSYDISSGIMTDLGPVPSAASLVGSSLYVNDRGDVALNLSYLNSLSYYYDATTKHWTQPNEPNGDQTVAVYGINNNVALCWGISGNFNHMFLYDGSTGTTEDLNSVIPPLPWWIGGVYPSGINDAGDIIGRVGTLSDSYAFLYESDTKLLIKLDVPGQGGNGFVPAAINNRGQVLGYNSVNASYSHWFLWTANAGVTDLGQAVTADFNDSGQVVLFSYDSDSNTSTSTLYSDGVFYDINPILPGRPTLMGRTDTRYHITDTGQIVIPRIITVQTPNGEIGTTHVFLLTPTSTTTIPPGAPGAVSDLTATTGDGQATISWSAPSVNTGPAIDHYDIVASDGVPADTVTATVPVSDPAAISFRTALAGLHNGTTYAISVTAHNAAGSGPAVTTSVMPATVPGTPIGLTATPGDGYTTVLWNPPADDGGAAISGYTITISAGSYSQTVQVSDLAAAALVGGGTAAYGVVVGGLANGPSYSISVTAHNSAGEGPAASTAVVPAATPGTPIGLTATAGVRQATVSWLAPPSDGGSPITGYVLQYTDGRSTQTLDVQGNTTSTTVTGLGLGTTCRFTVQAVNAIGTGPVSDSTTATLPDVPGTPVNFTATGGQGHAALKWDAAASDGGAPIDSYVVRALDITTLEDPFSSGSTAMIPVANPAATSFQTVLDQLGAGTGYILVVAAHNAVGYGPVATFLVSMPAGLFGQKPPSTSSSGAEGTPTTSGNNTALSDALILLASAVTNPVVLAPEAQSVPLSANSNALGTAAIGSSAALTAVPLSSGTEASSEVSGVVFEDVNADGQQDDGEQGIAGLTVVLEVRQGDAFVPVASTITDSHGRYAFSGLPAGTYRVEPVVPPGRWQGTGNSDRTLALPAASRVTGWNLGLTRLPMTQERLCRQVIDLAFQGWPGEPVRDRAASGARDTHELLADVMLANWSEDAILGWAAGVAGSSDLLEARVHGRYSSPSVLALPETGDRDCARKGDGSWAAALALATALMGDACLPQGAKPSQGKPIRKARA